MKFTRQFYLEFQTFHGGREDSVKNFSLSVLNLKESLRGIQLHESSLSLYKST